MAKAARPGGLPADMPSPGELPRPRNSEICRRRGVAISGSAVQFDPQATLAAGIAVCWMYRSWQRGIHEGRERTLPVVRGQPHVRFFSACPALLRFGRPWKLWRRVRRPRLGLRARLRLRRVLRWVSAFLIFSRKGFLGLSRRCHADDRFCNHSCGVTALWPVPCAAAPHVRYSRGGVARLLCSRSQRHVRPCALDHGYPWTFCFLAARASSILFPWVSPSSRDIFFSLLLWNLRFRESVLPLLPI